MVLPSNTSLGRYEILSQIGAGGMGDAYLAEDTQLGRRVATKLLPPQTISDEHARRRPVKEARLAATLDHGEARGALQSYLVSVIDSSVNSKKEEAWH